MSDDSQHHDETPGQSDQNNLTAHNGSSRRQSSGGAHADAGQPRLPQRSEILGRLNLLPGLVAMKVLSPSQANSIRSTCHTILIHLDKSPADTTAISDEDALKVLRRNPELLTLIESLLTNEQLHLIAREAANE